MDGLFDGKDVGDISQWLLSNGVNADVVAAFEDAEMDGDAVISALEVGPDAFTSLIPSLGKRLKLFRLINKYLLPKEKYQSTPHQIEKENEQEDTSSDSDGCLVVKQEEGKGSPIKRPCLDGGAITVLKRVSKKKQEEPLRQPFPLPQNFHHSVQEGLSNKCLTGKARGKFITAVASSIFHFKSFPTAAEYEHVACEIFKKWPFLRARNGDAFLTVGLKDRMKYMRGTSGRPRKCSPSTTQQQTPQKAKSDQQQFPDSPAAPLIPQGEDRQSHDRHVKLMVAECKKLHPNPEITAQLMKRTFAFRRADILSGEFPSVSDVLKCYPPLRNYGELKAEFGRIMEESSPGAVVADKLSEAWLELAEQIIVTAEKEVDNHNVQKMRTFVSGELSEECRCLQALILLYYLLPDTRSRADHVRLVCFFPEVESLTVAARSVTIPQPCIIVRGTDVQNMSQSYLVIEKELYCQVPVKEIVVALFSAFYVFNMTYTPGCSNVFSFFEHVFLNKSLKGKKQRLARVLAQLYPSE